MLVEPAELALDLQREFARRRNDKRDRISRFQPFGVAENCGSDRQPIGDCLAGACLGRNEDIAALGLAGQNRRLHRRGGIVVAIRERTGKRGVRLKKSHCEKPGIWETRRQNVPFYAATEEELSTNVGAVVRCPKSPGRSRKRTWRRLQCRQGSLEPSAAPLGARFRPPRNLDLRKRGAPCPPREPRSEIPNAFGWRPNRYVYRWKFRRRGRHPHACGAAR